MKLSASTPTHQQRSVAVGRDERAQLLCCWRVLVRNLVSRPNQMWNGGLVWSVEIQENKDKSKITITLKHSFSLE